MKQIPEGGCGRDHHFGWPPARILASGATAWGYYYSELKYLTKRLWHRRHIFLQNTSSLCADDTVNCAGNLSACPSALACLWLFHRENIAFDVLICKLVRI